MSRELRFNLIALVVVLILCAPGFFILISRRLGDTDRRADLPHPTPHSVAYVQPGPVPPGLPRVEPAVVRAWVDALLIQRTSAPMRRRMDNTAILSDDYRLQLMQSTATSDRTSVLILVWDENDLPAGMPRVAITGAIVGRPPNTAQPAAGGSNKPIAVPKQVREALQAAGYIDPPDRVWLIERTAIARVDPISTIEIYVDGKRNNRRTIDVAR